jgi:hypothetical protein
VVEVSEVESVKVKPPVSVEEKSHDPSKTPARGVARSSAGGSLRDEVEDVEFLVRDVDWWVSYLNSSLRHMKDVLEETPDFPRRSDFLYATERFIEITDDLLRKQRDIVTSLIGLEEEVEKLS